jgi:hypothetical protein
MMDRTCSMIDQSHFTFFAEMRTQMMNTFKYIVTLNYIRRTRLDETNKHYNICFFGGCQFQNIEVSIYHWIKSFYRMFFNWTKPLDKSLDKTTGQNHWTKPLTKTTDMKGIITLDVQNIHP